MTYVRDGTIGAVTAPSSGMGTFEKVALGAALLAVVVFVAPKARRAVKARRREKDWSRIYNSPRQVAIRAQAEIEDAAFYAEQKRLKAAGLPYDEY